METAQTADYALRVLIELERHDNQSVSELATRLSLSRSVVQRIVVTLHRRVMLLKSDDGRYSLGPGVIALARNLPHELATVAAPYIREFSDDVKEMIVLAVPEGDEAVVVACRSGSDWPLRIEYELGFSHSLAKGASGLAILAFQSEQDGARLLPRQGADTLAEIRRRGFAQTAGEIREHMVGLAAPVRASSDYVLGSLAIIAPSARADLFEGSVRRLVAVAEEIGAAYAAEYVDENERAVT